MQKGGHPELVEGVGSQRTYFDIPIAIGTIWQHTVRFVWNTKERLIKLKSIKN